MLGSNGRVTNDEGNALVNKACTMLGNGKDTRQVDLEMARAARAEGDEALATLLEGPHLRPR